MSLSADAAKGEIDPRAAGMLLLFNSMFPTVLGIAFHQKKAARGKFQTGSFQVSPGFVLQDESSFFAETQRGNDRPTAKFQLVVAVQSHAIAVMAIVIQ